MGVGWNVCIDDDDASRPTKWSDTGERQFVGYVEVFSEKDERVFVASEPLPEGIPIEYHLVGGRMVAFYVDGTEEDCGPIPPEEGPLESPRDGTSS